MEPGCLLGNDRHFNGLFDLSPPLNCRAHRQIQLQTQGAGHPGHSCHFKPSRNLSPARPIKNTVTALSKKVSPASVWVRSRGFWTSRAAQPHASPH